MNGKVKWICSRFELGAELSCLAPDLSCNYAPAFSLKECKCCQRGYTEGLWSELTFPAFFPMTHPSSSSPSANPDHSPAPPPHMGLCLFAVVPYISQYPQPVSWDRGTGFVLFPSYIVIYQGPLPSSGENESGIHNSSSPYYCYYMSYFNLFWWQEQSWYTDINYRCSPSESFYKCRGP